MTRIHVTLLGAAITLFAGCAGLPDTQPFTDATIGLRSAVSSSGTAVVAELRHTPLSGLAARATDLETAWTARNQAVGALVDYADSLQAIADAGRKGEESAKKLADAADALAKSLGAASLGAGAAGRLAADTFAYAYGQIAKARARQSLEAALAEVQPAIARIATLFAADLTSLDDAVRIAVMAERDALLSDHQREVAYRRQLIATQRELMGSVQVELEGNKSPAQLSRADELARVTELLAKNDAWHTAYQREQAAIAERGRLAHEIIAATQAALADWASAHARLLAAVRANRNPSMTELTEAVARIRSLVDRYRKL